MSHARKSPMKPSEFLAWEEQQELRWEFDGFRPVAINGGTVSHGRLQRNLMRSLWNRLEGGRCEPFGPSLKIGTPDGHYRYPDVFVTCSPVAGASTVVDVPVVIFEVLSPSTARTDRTTKLVEYRSIPTVQRYVMFEQDEAAATVITRTDHGWSIDLLRMDDVLGMPEIGIELPISEVYAGVELSPLPDE